MHKLFQVTFGMLKRPGNGSVFIDDVTIYTGAVECEFSKCPVYAELIDGRLIEVLTKKEIPFPTDNNLPGFAAHYLRPVTSDEDMKLAAYYVDWLSANIDVFDEAFTKTISFLDEKRRDYIDSYGEAISENGIGENSISRNQEIIDRALDGIDKSPIKPSV